MKNTGTLKQAINVSLETSLLYGISYNIINLWTLSKHYKFTRLLKFGDEYTVEYINTMGKLKEVSIDDIYNWFIDYYGFKNS